MNNETLVDVFNSIDIHGRAVMVWENGEFISTRDYYQQKVNLYSMPGFMVEVYYNPYLNEIRKIEILMDEKKIERYLNQFEIEDLF